MLNLLALVVIASAESQTGPPFAKDRAVLKNLAASVGKEGQVGKPDKQVDAFLSLRGKSVKGHSAYDSERRILFVQEPKPGTLVFLVPEKPFPEFGRTWVYQVSLDGKLLKAGVAEPRDPFKVLTDLKKAEAQCRSEIQHWAKHFANGS